MSASQDVLDTRQEDGIGFVAINRPDKRNAINDDVLYALRDYFTAPPEGVRVVVLSGKGGHFSAGLDLSEQVQREALEVMDHSRGWHRVMEAIQFGGLPVVAALDGAVMGGGLEMAAATHVRVTEPDAKFRMPEGQRGIFVGGGGTVRIGKIIGPDRMTEMMLTGRTYTGTEAAQLGLAHYLAETGGALARAEELARTIAQNSRVVNNLIIQAIARIDKMPREDGLFTESLAAALSQTGADAEEGLKAFLEKRPPKFS